MDGRISSSNGKSLTVTNRYDFPSGFDALTVGVGPRRHYVKKLLLSMIFLYLIVVIALTSGCRSSPAELQVAQSRDKEIHKPNSIFSTTMIRCIDGVEYIQIRGGQNGYMASHLKKDGSPYLCKGGYVMTQQVIK